LARHCDLTGVAIVKRWHADGAITVIRIYCVIVSAVLSCASWVQLRDASGGVETVLMNVADLGIWNCSAYAVGDGVIWIAFFITGTADHSFAFDIKETIYSNFL